LYVRDARVHPEPTEVTESPTFQEERDRRSRPSSIFCLLWMSLGATGCKVRNQVADDLKLFDVIVSNFNIEAIFNRNHQLDAVEKVSAEIVNKMGFACYKTGLNVEMFRDEKANIVQGRL